MKLEVEKNFTMLSTKEWMQYLQHKLPAERERELNEHLQYDDFLKEAVDSINALDGRHIAFQSLNHIHQQIFETTGVSESKIINSSYHSNTTSSSFNSKNLMYIIIGLVFILSLAFGLFWFLNTKSNSIEIDETIEKTEETLEIDNSPTQPIVDSTMLPLETIETTTPSATIISQTPVRNQNKSQNNTTTNEKVELNTSSSGSNNSTNNERAQFEQAQEYYKNGNIKEAKAILKKLSSYENSQTKQAESILKNIE